MPMRRLFAVITFAFLAVTVYAIPAKPGFRALTQPDGKTLLVQQRGDEWGSWFEDKSGQKYTMDNDGFFIPVSDAEVRIISHNASLRRAEAVNLQRSAPFTDMTHGLRHIPVFLIQFSDVKFRIDNPALNFNALLNEAGYNGYLGTGATGSVKDFYLDNSHGEFEPVFDIYGPVTVDNPISYYGEQVKSSAGTIISQDKQPELALYHACLQLDDIVDFSQYDYDNDNLVDMVLFYYAGGSQAEGWPANYIWPHSWTVLGSSSTEARTHTFDGKRLANYFCTAELKGIGQSATMCSIGPTCHEFGHSLGLPDFYDTDAVEYGNGENEGLYMFSTMCLGPYNDNSRTPPYFNTEEKIMLGWMEESGILQITAGENTLGFVDENVALFTYASADGEYFLYEKRGGAGNKWDSPLPEGLVVYQVDKSPYHTVYGSITAESIWNTNKINQFNGHPCFRLVPPKAQNATDYACTQMDYSDLVFPGHYGIDSYCAMDWDGVESDVMLTDIRVSGNQVLFTANLKSMEKFIEGTVVNTSSIPLQGVTVTLNPYTEASAGTNGIVIRKLMSTGKQEKVTDADGKFSFKISTETPVKFIVSVAMDGYVGQSASIEVMKTINRVDFSLRKVGEFGLTGMFDFWDTSTKSYVLFGSEGQTSIMAAAKCSRDVWGAYEGLLVKSVALLMFFDADAYYFILDSPDGITSVKSPSVKEGTIVEYDIDDKGIRIPQGDFYIGIAVENTHPNDYNYPLVVPSGVGCYGSPLKLEGHGSWAYQDGYDVPLEITLYDEEYNPDIADFGNPYIDIAPGKFFVGDEIKLSVKIAPGALVKSITWTFDSERRTDGSTVTFLSSGWHTLSATVTYLDGSKEIIEREIEVK